MTLINSNVIMNNIRDIPILHPYQEVVKVTQSNGGNGSQQPNPKDLQVFEPAFAPGNEEGEKIGWYKTDVKGEEGTLIPDSGLPPELKDKPPDNAS